MLDLAAIRENYSGTVKIRLLMGEQDFELSKLGPEYIVFRQAVELPPCHGEIVMTIDQREHRWTVNLPEGADCSMTTVTAKKC